LLRVDRLDGRAHDRESFACGVAELDHYLRQLATQHHRDGISTTHVLVEDALPRRILGFYTLAAAQVTLAELQPADQRRLPRHPVPAARLARLAVAVEEQRQGLGAALLQDAVIRCLDLRAGLGIRLLLVEAKGERAQAFYQAFGFLAVAEAARTLYLPLGAH
jgi:GNAT superfamily N-acetyltransferase